MKQGTLIIVILVSAVLFLGGVAVFIACSNNPKDKAVAVAEKALMASVDNPQSVKIIGISKADSVFGKEYVTMEERKSLSVAMMKINEKVMKETDGFEDFNPENKEVVALMQRQMSVMSVLRSIVSVSPNPLPHGQKEPCNGWKVKIEYEAKDKGGRAYRSEYWFILDKEAVCVVKSFEVPII